MSGWHKTAGEFHSHRKVKAIPMRRRHKDLGLWILAASWCSDNETPDRAGHLPQHMLKELGGSIGSAASLVSVGLWEADPGGDGWWFHDWIDYRENPEKKARRLALAAGRQARYVGRLRGDDASTRPSTRPSTRQSTRPTTRPSTSTPTGPPPAETGNTDASVTVSRPDPSRNAVKGRGEDGQEPGSTGSRFAPPSDPDDYLADVDYDAVKRAALAVLDTHTGWRTGRSVAGITASLRGELGADEMLDRYLAEIVTGWLRNGE